MLCFYFEKWAVKMLSNLVVVLSTKGFNLSLERFILYKVLLKITKQSLFLKQNKQQQQE